jgi:transposase
MIPGLLAEFGIEIARDLLRHALEPAAWLSAGAAAEVPPLAQRVVTGLADQTGALQMKPSFSTINTIRGTTNGPGFMAF